MECEGAGWRRREPGERLATSAKRERIDCGRALAGFDAKEIKLKPFGGGGRIRGRREERRGERRGDTVTFKPLTADLADLRTDAKVRGASAQTRVAE